MHEQANRNEYNFDHPDAFDFELLVETLKKLKEGKHVEVCHSSNKQIKKEYANNIKEKVEFWEEVKK